MKQIVFLILSMLISMNVPICGQTSVDADKVKVWVDKAQTLFDEGDYQGAYEWYLKAAEQGNSFAEFAIGALYLSGLYVKQDYEKSILLVSEGYVARRG